MIGENKTFAYPVQDDIDLTACIDDGLFTAELDHFAEHANDTVLEV